MKKLALSENFLLLSGIRDIIMYPGLETVCAVHRVLGNKEWPISVTSLIIHEL